MFSYLSCGELAGIHLLSDYFNRKIPCPICRPWLLIQLQVLLSLLFSQSSYWTTCLISFLLTLNLCEPYYTATQSAFLYWKSRTLIFNKPMFCLLCGMSAWMGGSMGRSSYNAHCEVPISCRYSEPRLNKTLYQIRLLSVHFWKESLNHCLKKNGSTMCCDMETHKITRGCDIWLELYMYMKEKVGAVIMVEKQVSRDYS